LQGRLSIFDFTGGANFSKETLSELGKILSKQLEEKYGLKVTVSEPQKDTGNVDTWKTKIETRPELKNFPAQRINIDICAIPSYEKRPMMLLNPYGVDMGTSGLIIQTQSQEEIYTDKLLAFALRPNRIKHRDLWDIIWLHQKGLKPNLKLIKNKIKDHHVSKDDFLKRFSDRIATLENEKKLEDDFKQEMNRFLPAKDVIKTLEQENFWDFLKWLMHDFKVQIENTLQISS